MRTFKVILADDNVKSSTYTFLGQYAIWEATNKSTGQTKENEDIQGRPGQWQCEIFQLHFFRTISNEMPAINPSQTKENKDIWAKILLSPDERVLAFVFVFVIVDSQKKT